MVNKKLLSCGIDELRENLVRFHFSDGGYFSGYGNIDLVKNDTQIKYTYSHSLKRRKRKFTFTKEKWDEFVGKIFEENIYKWKKSYYTDICDGEQWHLEMEFNDFPKFESSGSNGYPRNWDKFKTVIKEYFPLMN
jgi:hypothetical protein